MIIELSRLVLSNTLYFYIDISRKVNKTNTPTACIHWDMIDECTEPKSLKCIHILK